MKCHKIFFFLLLLLLLLQAKGLFHKNINSATRLAILQGSVAAPAVLIGLQLRCLRRTSGSLGGLMEDLIIYGEEATLPGSGGHLKC